MGAFNTRDTYGWGTIVLHWLLFLLITGMLAGGIYSDSLPPGGKNTMLISIHKQMGVAVLALMLFRLIWRLINRGVESLVESFYQFMAGVVALLMYLAVISQALIGIAMSQLSGRDVVFLGLELPVIAGAKGYVPLPEFVIGEGAKNAAEILREWHWFCGYFIIGLIALHSLAAIWHALEGTGLLRRMWFGYQPEYASKRGKR